MALLRPTFILSGPSNGTCMISHRTGKTREFVARPLSISSYLMYDDRKSLSRKRKEGKFTRIANRQIPFLKEVGLVHEWNPWQRTGNSYTDFTYNIKKEGHPLDGDGLPMKAFKFEPPKPRLPWAMDNQTDEPPPDFFKPADKKNAARFHVVRRHKCIKGRPYWEKEMIDHLGLYRRLRPVVMRNSPGINAKLYVIKHLVRIDPLEVAGELPERSEDVGEINLSCTGRLTFRLRSDAKELNINESSKDLSSKDLGTDSKDPNMRGVSVKQDIDDKEWDELEFDESPKKDKRQLVKYMFTNMDCYHTPFNVWHPKQVALKEKHDKSKKEFYDYHLNRP